MRLWGKQQIGYPDYLRLLAEFDPDEVRVVILSGLPGSGKSTLGEILSDCFGYQYLSSDIARVELMKLTKGKFATTKEYEIFKARVYQYMREQAVKLVNEGEKVVLDATHLNEQRTILLSYLRAQGMGEGSVRVVYVDGGSRERIKRRFEGRNGRNADGRSWVEAWETAYDYFADKIRTRTITIPEGTDGGYQVIWVKNY